MELRDYIIPIKKNYKFSGKKRSMPEVLIQILDAAGAPCITEGMAKSWLAAANSSAHRNCSAQFPEDRVNREKLTKLFNDKIGDSWKLVQRDFGSNEDNLIDTDTCDKDVFFQSLINQLELIFGLHLTSDEMESEDQNKTVAKYMCKYFERKYSVYRVDEFLNIGLEDEVNRTLLGYAEQFIKVINDKLLQPCNLLQLDDMAKVMYLQINEYIGTLEHYKNDLVCFFEKYGNARLPAYTTYFQPKIDSSDKITPLMRYNADMVTKNIAICLGRSQIKAQEMNIVDSIEHNRKELSVLYRRIISKV